MLNSEFCTFKDGTCSKRGRLFRFLPHHIAVGQFHRDTIHRPRQTGKRDMYINSYNVINKMEEDCMKRDYIYSKKDNL